MCKVVEDYYVKNFGRWVKIMTFRLWDRAAGEDVVQDAFERALKYSKGHDPARQEFNTWFSSVINNCLRDFQRVERMGGMSLEFDEELCDGEAMLDWEDDMICMIKEEIGKKSVFVANALHLYFFAQYKPREIAQIIGMSNAHIRTCVKEFKQSMALKYGGSL